MIVRAAPLAVLLLLAGCGKEHGVYDIPVHEAYQRLAGNELKDLRANEQCGILIQFVPAGVPDRSVTWAVASEGEELFHFTANLVPVGDKTRVQVEVSRDPYTPQDHEAYDGSQFYRRPAMESPARPRIEEAIAAILEGRPYDLGHVKDVGRSQVCGVQRGKIESGMGAFSIHDQPGED
jgi:hypothetical protein